MKLLCVVLLFMFVMAAAIKTPVENAYKEYRHNRIVSECKKEVGGPSWTHGIVNYGCEHWAD